MTEASRAHQAELADDADPRARRDQAFLAIRALLVPLRSVVELVYGQPGLKRIELDRPTPVDPKELKETAGAVLRHLRDPHFKWPKRLQDGVSVDPQHWIDELEKPVEALAAALKDVAREEREAEGTLGKKTETIAAFDQLYRRTANLVAAVLELGGQDDLAARLRPAARRTSGEPDPGEPDGATTAPTPVEKVA
jgi:hypothetical protein